MVTFDYNANKSWGCFGWLESSAYHNFWGRVFSHDLSDYLLKKKILDVGSGDGRVWLSALDLGLVVKELHLIDPALKIIPNLTQRPEIVTYKKSLQEWPPIPVDVIVFKQSIHHLYDALGTDLFAPLKADCFINFSMPSCPEWPMSPALLERYKPSVLDIKEMISQAGKSIKTSFIFSFPVEMHQNEWCEMLHQRFSSILHDCDDEFIEQEISWLKQNQPNILRFNDSLECLVFI